MPTTPADRLMDRIIEWIRDEDMTTAEASAVLDEACDAAGAWIDNTMQDEIEAAEAANRDCPTCGGSGGGPEHWRCPSCLGSGQRKIVHEREE